jgi:hypothetical protein
MQISVEADAARSDAGGAAEDAAAAAKKREHEQRAAKATAYLASLSGGGGSDVAETKAEKAPETNTENEETEKRSSTTGATAAQLYLQRLAQSTADGSARRDSGNKDGTKQETASTLEKFGIDVSTDVPSPTAAGLPSPKGSTETMEGAGEGAEGDAQKKGGENNWGEPFLM